MWETVKKTASSPAAVIGGIGGLLAGAWLGLKTLGSKFGMLLGAIGLAIAGVVMGRMADAPAAETPEKTGLQRGAIETPAPAAPAPGAEQKLTMRYEPDAKMAQNIRDTFKEDPKASWLERKNPMSDYNLKKLVRGGMLNSSIEFHGTLKTVGGAPELHVTSFTPSTTEPFFKNLGAAAFKETALPPGYNAVLPLKKTPKNTYVLDTSSPKMLIELNRLALHAVKDTSLAPHEKGQMMVNGQRIATHLGSHLIKDMAKEHGIDAVGRLFEHVMTDHIKLLGGDPAKEKDVIAGYKKLITDKYKDPAFRAKSMKDGFTEIGNEMIKLKNNTRVVIVDPAKPLAIEITSRGDKNHVPQLKEFTLLLLGNCHQSLCDGLNEHEKKKKAVNAGHAPIDPLAKAADQYRDAAYIPETPTEFNDPAIPANVQAAKNKTAISPC